MFEMVFVLLLRLILGDLVSRECRPSVPPRGGRIASCCGCYGDSCEPRAYYWTGTACAPDKFCQCDSELASPYWPTLRECERAHRGCRQGSAR